MNVDTLTYDEWDALLIEEWARADPGAPVPASSREGEFEWAYENQAAWALVDESSLNGMSKAAVEQVMREANDQLRHLPELHDQKSHGRRKGLERLTKGVRSILMNAETIEDINSVTASEVRRVTGRNILVDFVGSHPDIARAHAEGVLRGFEQYPRAPIAVVTSYGVNSDYVGARRSRAVIAYNLGEVATEMQAGRSVDVDHIAFNNWYASHPARYLSEAEKSDQERFGPSGTGMPVAVAQHEFAHSLGRYTNTEALALQLTKKLAEVVGVDRSDYVLQNIGLYATSDELELVADAYADVKINDGKASALSRAIASILDREYRKRFDPQGAGVT